MKTILTNCTVIDCTGQPPLENTTVVVEGEKIAELQPGIYRQAARAGERVFDLWREATFSLACGTSTPI